MTRSDNAYWTSLARAAGVRLPRSSAKLTTGSIRRWCRKLGIDWSDYLAWGNFKTSRDFSRLNPDWNLHDLVGLLLELRQDLASRKGDKR